MAASVSREKGSSHTSRSSPTMSTRRSELSKIDIWYATFGSNMWEPRFLCYIQGGQVEGMRKPCSGSVDRSPPKDIIWKTFPHRLFFGRESSVWGGHGVAFLHPDSSVHEKTYMCLYKITLEQFNEVLLRENASSPGTNSPAFDLTALNSVKQRGSMEVLKRGWYRNVIYLGEEHGIPIVTMTCPLSDIDSFKSGKLSRRAPCTQYTDALVKGLAGGRQLSAEEATAYIKEASDKPLL